MSISHGDFLPTLLYSNIYAPAIKVKLYSVMVFWIENIIFPLLYDHPLVARKVATLTALL